MTEQPAELVPSEPAGPPTPDRLNLEFTYTLFDDRCKLARQPGSEEDDHCCRPRGHEGNYHANLSGVWQSDATPPPWSPFGMGHMN